MAGFQSDDTSQAGIVVPFSAPGERLFRGVALAGLVAVTFSLGSAPACAQTPAPPSPVAAMQAKRAALLQQCPDQPNVADAAALPIHVRHWSSAGPRVLMVHGGVQGGLGGGPSTFDGQEALAARGWQIEVVDRPGFGQSPSRGPDDMEADAVWIADMLGGGAHVVAHSWGAAEALLAAARRPEAVASLVLVEPALEALLPTDPGFKNNAVAQAAISMRMQQIMSASTPAEYSMSFVRSLGTADTGTDNPNAVAAALAADPAQAARIGCSLLRGKMASPQAFLQAAEAVARAGVPVLVISGGWSPAYVAAGELTAKLTNGRHMIVSSPSHFVQMANAPAFNDAVDQFMREAEAKKRTRAP